MRTFFKQQKGFTIFFAVLVTSLALAIGLSIYDLTVRELDLSATVNQSQYAIYAADTGAECALYWDTHCNFSGCTAGSAFPTSTESTVPGTGEGLLCNGQDIVATPWTVSEGDTSASTTITVNFLPQPYCAVITISKTGTPSHTTIVSYGYNTCAGGVARVERALQVSY
jgi:hypothetical protein